MIDVSAPSFALDRRDFISGGAAGAAALAAAPLAAGSTGATELETAFLMLPPERMLDELERIERSLDEEDVVWWYQFFFFGIVPDRSPIRLIRYEGIEMSRCRHVGPGRLEVHGHNISFPRTMDGSAWLETWANPYTGAALAAQDNVIADDPGYEKSVAGVRPLTSIKPPRPLDFFFRREGGMVKLERVRVPPPEWPGQFIETSTVSVSAADYADKRQRRLPAQGSGMWVQPFPKWMGMEGRPGHLVGYFNGSKVGPPSALPRPFRERLAARYPDLTTVPKSKFGKLK
jgi:hypothetical protein